jgi:hypothetical protein
MMGMGRESTSTPDMAQKVPTNLPKPSKNKKIIYIKFYLRNRKF